MHPRHARIIARLATRRSRHAPSRPKLQPMRKPLAGDPLRLYRVLAGGW